MQLVQKYLTRSSAADANEAKTVSRMRIGKTVALGEGGKDLVLAGDKRSSLVNAGLMRRCLP